MFEIEGIVIRVTPFRENDAIVNVLCSDRICSFLARGVLKYESKNSSCVNMYVKGRFQLTKGKEGYSLRTGEVLSSNYNIKNNLSALAVADLLGEITNKLIQSEDAASAYAWLDKSLKLLDSGFDPYTVGLIYLATVLKNIGYGLNVDSCVICGQTSQIIAVSYKDGGFICSDCFDALNHVKCSSRKLKIIRYIFKVDLDSYGGYSFEKDECIDLFNELNMFIKDTLQINIKSLDFIKRL